MIDELTALALDLTWTWDARIRAAFEALDPELWTATRHNPIAMLTQLRSRAVIRPTDAFFGAMVDAHTALDQHRRMGAPLAEAGKQLLVAYFSLEFGLTECMAMYSGGLGVLAGDHLKAASDLGLPMVAVGLLYRHGFPYQRINAAGEQEEIYPQIEPEDLPLVPVLRDGEPLEVEAPIGSFAARVRAWKAQVGRVSLYLLDTDLEGNPPEVRSITDHLYTPYSDHRLRQEIVLGIGGVRLLRALELPVTVFHLNEGHSFLAGLERRRELQESGLAPDEARRASKAGVVFTTHTAIAAGSDYFPPHEVSELLGPYLAAMRIRVEEFLDVGRSRPGDRGEPLCSTVAALRLAEHTFAVSRIHAQVSRRLWHGVWSNVDEELLPIDHVTNGVHMPEWIAQPLGGLLSWQVGPDWWEMDEADERWNRIDGIPSGQLWELRNRLRQELADFVARRCGGQWRLDPEALTIGFSRRFAGYKRATLLLSDEERLVHLLTSPGRPVQFVFAGKAHPADQQGKDLVRQVVMLSRRHPQVTFLEDYDIEVARELVQGADVWLNNPRRFLEASGTSGMKAAANGGLNVSILDGWWDEAYRPDVGWFIPSEATLEEPEVNDRVEAERLYDLLEQQVVPLFYERDQNERPEAWLRMVRASIKHAVTNFSARRMVTDYFYLAYGPAARRAHRAEPPEPRD